MPHKYDKLPLLPNESARHTSGIFRRALARLAGRANNLSPIDQADIAPLQDTRAEHEQPPRALSFSITSEKHPERNEDSHFTTDIAGRVLAGGVFDGVGGDAGSERASQIAAEHLADSFSILDNSNMTPDQAASFARDHVLFTNATIAGDKIPHIKTTIALASIHTDPHTHNQFASLTWAGDSRVYIIRNGAIVYRTLDDGASNAATIPLLDDMYPEEALNYRAQAFLESVDEDPCYELWPIFHFRNAITNCLGSGSSLPVLHQASVPVEPKDTVLITSDGIHDNLTNREILSLLAGGATVEELTNAALARSQNKDHIRAKSDDMTAVTLTV